MLLLSSYLQNTIICIILGNTGKYQIEIIIMLVGEVYIPGENQCTVHQQLVVCKLPAKVR